MENIPTPGPALTKLVPHWCAESEDKFVSTSLFTPHADPDTGVMTSFLKIGTKLDLLGISLTKNLLDTGAADITDSVDVGITLAQILFTDANGTPMVADVSELPFSVFCIKVSDYATMEVRTSVQVDSGEVVGNIAFGGEVNVQLGTCCIEATTVEGNFTAQGYKLLVNRVNSNRRPAPSVKDYIDETGLPHIVTLHHIPGAVEKVKIVAEGDRGAGGDFVHYRVSNLNLHNHREANNLYGDLRPMDSVDIFFRNGEMAPEMEHNGVTIEHLLAISGHRLEMFQTGPFANDNNAKALYHIKEAIAALNERTIERLERGVKGTLTP
jgi:hypothetical protein